MTKVLILSAHQACVCRPTEDGMDVYASTQWLELTQQSVAMVLGVPINR